MLENRIYPKLNTSLQLQLNAIEPSIDRFSTRYYPCIVKLLNGEWQAYVVITESSEYIKVWGVWPNQDKSKKEIKLEKITEVKESPNRLPWYLAQKLYDAGESGMGYYLFAIRYKDKSISYHYSGNFVDFVILSQGKNPQDIEDVLPHAGRDENPIKSPDYAWCLYSV